MQQFRRRHLAMASLRLFCLTSACCNLWSADLVIHLQNAPNNMEPADEPRRIRVDDRTKVTIVLSNLGPLDVCSTGARSVTPTVETNPIESLITTISAGGGFALAGASAPKVTAPATEQSVTITVAAPSIRDSADWAQFQEAKRQFEQALREAAELQKALQNDLRDASRSVIDYSAQDFRGMKWRNFRPETDDRLSAVRDLSQNALSSVRSAGIVQAYLSEMTSHAANLHKSFDPQSDSSVQSDLVQIDRSLAVSTAQASVIGDNNTTLKAAQGSLSAAYLALVAVVRDFEHRLDLNIVRRSENGEFLYQTFALGTDRKAMITNTLACVSDTDMKTPTTNPISYTVLYQDVPRLTASAGVLTTFLEKKVIGTIDVAAPVTATNMAGYTSLFAVTDRAQAQVFPMAFVNYRLLPFQSFRWGRTREDELVFTSALSAGFGINPNSGTSQPEFFVGGAFGFNRLMIHPGLHIGRVESLGGGFALNSAAPAMVTAPINWNYHLAFSVGFSVRVAPY